MKYPIGIQNFESLREDGYVYVDKTERIHQLVTNGKYYFLSRPRRFGKSLLVSTLRAYFEGKKELFDGLAMARLEREWRVHPVLHLDLNSGQYDSIEALNEKLTHNLSGWENTWGLKADAGLSISSRFENVIRAACKQSEQKVVILVDEYDKPLLAAIDNPELQSSFRSMLKAFYGNLKSCDEYIRFALLTGVTKFSHVSIFSDLNNLTDISLDGRYADLCGITSEELHHCFAPDIQALADKEGVTSDEMMNQLRQMYDGYHFSKEMTSDMYNPFSLLNALNSHNIDNYWFSTGTPTFLIKLLQQYDYPLQQFSTGDVTVKTLSSKESVTDEPLALFYQTGYLTIKGYDREFGSYRLGFPNREVEESFLNFLLPRYVGGTENRSSFFIENFVRDLRKGDINGFMERMKSFFADTPYELIKDVENHYQNVMFTICRLMGYYTVAEYRTSRGRIDMVVKASDYNYVFEFKFDKSAKDALGQIDTKEYLLPFATEGKHLIKVGVNFSKETRNIDDYCYLEA